MYITNIKIITMEEENYEKGYIRIHQGKIAEIGEMTQFVPKENDTQWNCEGMTALPGFVDGLCHHGLWRESSNWEESDLDECNDPVTPQVRAMDGIYPFDPAIEKSLNAGITTSIISPGDKNVCGGQAAAVKNMGNTVDKMVFEPYVGMKMAFGEAVLDYYRSKNQMPSTRASAYEMAYALLEKAFHYEACRERMEYDWKMEALIPVVQGKKPLLFHALRSDDVMSALRLCKNFNLKPVLLHAFGLKSIWDSIPDIPFSVLAGPFLVWNDQTERKDLDFSIIKELQTRKIPYATIMDSASGTFRLPVSSWFYKVQMGRLMANGISQEEVLKSMTIYPAEIYGIDHKVGSIKVGKDADIVLWNRMPPEHGSRIEAVFCNGEKIERK